MKNRTGAKDLATSWGRNAFFHHYKEMSSSDISFGIRGISQHSAYFTSSVITRNILL